MFAVFRREPAKGESAEARAEKLRNIVLKQGSNERASEESQKAIAYCEWCISEYEGWFDYNETRWLRWQKITIIGGVIATLAGVITVPEHWLAWAPDLQSFSWVRGVPAAIATIAASYLGSFNYREDAVRHELTANALWNELAKYQARAEPYNNGESKDTSAFLTNVCRLVESELHSWSALVRGRNTEAEAPVQKSTDGSNAKNAHAAAPAAPSLDR
jgi:hypothetical protein